MLQKLNISITLTALLVTALLISACSCPGPQTVVVKEPVKIQPPAHLLTPLQPWMPLQLPQISPKTDTGLSQIMPNVPLFLNGSKQEL